VGLGVGKEKAPARHALATGATAGRKEMVPPFWSEAWHTPTHLHPRTTKHHQHHCLHTTPHPPLLRATSDQLAPLAGVTRLTWPLLTSTATTAVRLQAGRQGGREAARQGARRAGHGRSRHLCD